MGDMLSQDEINALLGPSGHDPEPEPLGGDNNLDEILSTEQKDILGEVGNISMGTAATTLFALLNQKVWITTPVVSLMTWSDLSASYDRPCVGVRVDYKDGLRGANVLILKEKDVRIIANLMMGGDGQVDDDGELTELDLSAIGEAMNQMVGSSSTSLSSMIKRRIDIDTPHAFVLDFTNETFFDSIGFAADDIIVCVSFKMEIGTFLKSGIMQILPLEFAMDMVDMMKNDFGSLPESPPTEPATPPAARQAPQAPAARRMPEPIAMQPSAETQPSAMQQAAMQQAAPQPPYYPPPQPQANVNVQPVKFQDFDLSQAVQQKENIEIIMDVPLEISVELGRTHKKIKEILEFSPGVIVELDKLAGEPIDILVNGKFVAKGEVVVIDENFGIRITDIVSVDKRI
ncbi:MAG: flagellar motor switch phosphatase FliY [Clostridiales bacterium]|jgi:flagellar motor switch protein FliN/FliY|nr:flagellar motor switch phosphatase FliY [Clostridiales bacterium]